MKITVNEFAEHMMNIVCMLKVLHDAGISDLERSYADDILHIDYYYEMVIEALYNAAPIVNSYVNLYKKFGYDEDDDVNITAYSSEEMKKCFNIAYKMDRLEKGLPRKSKYVKQLEEDMEDIRGFHSYNFDWIIGRKRKGAQLEIIYAYEFTEEVAMCLWIVRVMEMFKEKLPELREKYRQLRRQKRLMKPRKSGGVLCAA